MILNKTLSKKYILWRMMMDTWILFWIKSLTRVFLCIQHARKKIYVVDNKFK